MQQEELKLPPFSSALQNKIAHLRALQRVRPLGRNAFVTTSPLLLAPLAGLTQVPFRLLMQDLGAGGAVTELISANGIYYQNQQTLDLLQIDPREQCCGLQLFGEDIEKMVAAAKVVDGLPIRPRFLDINMGCPVKKVVQKGAGAALLRDPGHIIEMVNELACQIQLPITIKIRLGWTSSEITAPTIVQGLQNCKRLEFVAIHGRTRDQFYKGDVDWAMIEKIAQESALPIIGNGNLFTPTQVATCLQQTACHALMLGRGPLDNPFLFLESTDKNAEIKFTAQDYGEVYQRLVAYTLAWYQDERPILLDLKKFAQYFSQGFPFASNLRVQLYQQKEIAPLIAMVNDFFARTHH